MNLTLHAQPAYLTTQQSTPTQLQPFIKMALNLPRPPIQNFQISHKNNNKQEIYINMSLINTEPLGFAAHLSPLPRLRVSSPGSEE